MKEVKQVEAIVTLDGLLTKGHVYTVLNENKGYITIHDDRGIACVYSESRFSTTLSPKATPDFSENEPIRDEVNITCPVVEEAEKRKAAIALKNAMLDGNLLTQIDARREIALQDCDANLAALLYRAKDRIIELENQMTVPKRGAQ